MKCKFKFINIILAIIIILLMTSVTCFADAPANNNIAGEDIVNDNGQLERDLNDARTPDTTMTNPNPDTLPDNNTQNNTLLGNNINFNTGGLIIAIVIAVAVIILIIVLIPKNRHRRSINRR